MRDAVLIIKLGAMGDVVQSFGLMRAIRHHHDDATITILTTPPFESLMVSSGIADEVVALPRPKAYQLGLWWRLRGIIRDHTHIYDLQNNDKTKILYGLSRPKHWIGKVTGYNAQKDKSLHLFEAHTRNLGRAGVSVAGPDPLSWMADQANSQDRNIPHPYALLVPGSAPQHPGKRWPYYGDLAIELLNHGLTPVLLGTQAEADILAAIAERDERIINLCARTNLGQIVALAQGAALAVGNDTGPMHFIGPTGCKSISLFSGLTSPDRYHPLGDHVHCLQKASLQDLSVEDVLDSLAVFEAVPDKRDIDQKASSDNQAATP